MSDPLVEGTVSFTNCTLVDSTTIICWLSPLVILGCQVYFVIFILFLMENLLANTVDPDQTPNNVASDLSLYCMPMTPF